MIMGTRVIAALAVVWAGMLFGSVVSAQAPSEAEMREMMEKMQQMQRQGGPSEAQLKMIMEQASAMQACVADIDMNVLQGFEQESQAMMAEVKTLCANGNRAAAQDKAMAFGQRMAATPEMKKMRECSAEMPPLLAMAAQQGTEPAAGQPAHVCDNL